MQGVVCMVLVVHNIVKRYNKNPTNQINRVVSIKFMVVLESE
jgi:hypothetical protein